MDHQTLQQYFRWRIALIVCICLTVAVIILAVFKDKGWLDVRARAKHLTAVESQIRDIEAENQRLTGEIQALRTDPAAIEKIAREQLKQQLEYNASNMCGRAYKTYSDEELYFQYLNKRPLILRQVTPDYNLCPTQNSLVLRLSDGEPQFDEMRWQLLPDWEPLRHLKSHRGIRHRGPAGNSGVFLLGGKGNVDGY